MQQALFTYEATSQRNSRLWGIILLVLTAAIDPGSLTCCGVGRWSTPCWTFSRRSPSLSRLWYVHTLRVLNGVCIWCCKVCGKWEDTSGQVFQIQFKYVCVHACIMSMMCGAHKLFSGTNGNWWLEFKACTTCWIIAAIIKPITMVMFFSPIIRESVDSLHYGGMAPIRNICNT